MRTSSRLHVPSVLALCLLASFGVGVLSARADAFSLDDDGNSAAPRTDAKKAATSPADPSAGWTEREKMLLDRVEQLERRVAELEAGHSSQNTPAASPAPPATLGAMASRSATDMPAPPAPSSVSPASAAGKADPPAEAAPAASPSGRAALESSARVSQSQAADQPQAQQQAASEPFAFADFTWLNGNPRTKEIPFDTKFFTPEIRSDVDYIYDFRHPQDDTISGSSEVFRSNEVQLTQLGVGGDFHFDNVRARLMTQFGMYSQTTPRNDASPARGQWNLADAYRYLSEAYGGYHFNVLHGVNVDAGIFMSYVGLFSYYNFDNWAYQPSYVSSNTPWFFNGVRIQIFPTEHLKLEPWIVNGWQSYGRFNNRPGIGLQFLYRPNGWFSVLGNQYMLGEDTLATPGRVRYHTDNSVQIKYYDNPERVLDKLAFSLTGDMGCEHGGGVTCDTNSHKGPKQDFLGFMFYNRAWFDHDLFGLTIGGGKINNPGRYLVLLPPINGATAASGTSYFTENPGDPFKAWDMSATFDWMPSQYITWRWEYNYRAANVPYFSGPGGVTPPGGNQGAPGSLVPGWAPDLRRSENRLNIAILVKF
jgi:hypothetical protein